MTEIYTAAELQAAVGRKKAYLRGYLISLGVLLAALIVLFVLATRETAPTLRFISILLSIIFGCGSLYFFAMIFRPLKAYARLLGGMINGIKESAEGDYLRTEEKTEEKDGVECTAFIIEVTSFKHDELVMERKVLVDNKKPLPDILSGQRIKVSTYGNVLVAYQIKQKKMSPAGLPTDANNQNII